MTHAESTTLDEWSSLADLLANLIAKYAPVLDLDATTAVSDASVIPFLQGSPKPGASPCFGVAYDTAA